MIMQHRMAMIAIAHFEILFAPLLIACGVLHRSNIDKLVQ